MKIKIKKLHADAKMPTRGTSGAAAFDLYASETVGLPSSRAAKIPTGIAMEIPEGYCGMIYTRSSSPIRGLQVHTTVVDSDYRGELFITVNVMPGVYDAPTKVDAGERVAQLRIEKVEDVHFEWSDTLSQTERGAGGYGDQVVRFKPIQADGGRRRRRLDLSTRAPRRGQLLRKI